MPQPDRVRVVADLTAIAATKTLSGTFAIDVDGRRIYGVKLTDADESEMKETLDEISAALVEAGLEAIGDDEDDELEAPPDE